MRKIGKKNIFMGQGELIKEIYFIRVIVSGKLSTVEKFYWKI